MAIINPEDCEYPGPAKTEEQEYLEEISRSKERMLINLGQEKSKALIAALEAERDQAHAERDIARRAAEDLKKDICNGSVYYSSDFKECEYKPRGPVWCSEYCARGLRKLIAVLK